MSGGDWFVVLFVGIIFILGIYGGIKLFLWNKRDHEKMMARNEELKKPEDDVRERHDAKTASNAGTDGNDQSKT